ncbi:MAG TPA: AAA family ATPase, partial [Actinomycetes bacterium]
MGDPSLPGGARRKLVTVLVADVDEVVTDFADPDPEDTARGLAAPLARVRSEVEAFGGVVEETVGGRTVAVFGVPRTRDDDPERAVRAALAIRDALGGTGGGAGAPQAGAAGAPQAGAAGAPQAEAAGLRVQAAVATGEALVRAGEGRQPGHRRVPGDLLAACARLQEAAIAGAVLVTEATRRATERAIAYQPTPRVSLPGGAPAWTATATLGLPGEGPGRDRRAPRFPPLIARDAELGVLLEAAGRAAAGTPQLVTVLGAAGIGKSRLLAELADRLAVAPPGGVPVAWRQGRSLPYGEDPSFGALAEAVRAELGVRQTDAAGGSGLRSASGSGLRGASGGGLRSGSPAERRLAASVAGAVADPATAAWVAG